MKIHVDFTLEIDRKYLPALRDLAESDDDSNVAAIFVRGEAEDLIVGYLEENGVPVLIVAREGRPVNAPPDPAVDPYSDESYWSSRTGFLLHLYRHDRGDREAAWCGVDLVDVVANTEGRRVCRRCLGNLKVYQQQQ
jgi:hypothetical protein